MRSTIRESPLQGVFRTFPRWSSFMKNWFSGPICAVVTLFCLSPLATSPAIAAATSNGQEESQQPAGSVVVQDMFGGQIFGYGVDQNGTEGLLSEAALQPDGSLTIATETFDQNTGRIVALVEKKTETQDNFVTLGVFGNHVAIRQDQHVQGGYVRLRTYSAMSPLSGNRFTGIWWVPLNDKTQLFEDVEGDQGNPNVAVMASNFECCSRFVFGSNVATNQFGPMITLQDQIFTQGVPPLLAYDSQTNQAVLAQAQGAPYSTPQLALVNLSTRVVSEFRGLGDGYVNGLAVDSATGIACTTTETDNSAEFYNLATKRGFIVVLPFIGQYSAATVAVDRVNKLFLIAHPRPGAPGAIHVYDENGNFVETLEGFVMGPGGATLALNPSKRVGFIQFPGSNRNLSGLRSFTY
jgi:hypothetical protein